MKYAAVQHKKNNRKWYWFYIPEELEDKVSAGSKVICDTKHGRSSGYVITISDTDVALPNDTGMIKPVVAVYTDVPVSNIEVPYKFLTSKPSPKKIEHRVEELYTSGRFSTRVTFRHDNVLLDGYTAYLVAKAFDLQDIRGLCVLGKEAIKQQQAFCS